MSDLLPSSLQKSDSSESQFSRSKSLFSYFTDKKRAIRSKTKEQITNPVFFPADLLVLGGGLSCMDLLPDCRPA